MRQRSEQRVVAGAPRTPPMHAETLLDDIIPVADFGNRHAIRIAAPAARVAAAMEAYSMGRDGSLFVRLLFRLRGLRVGGETLRAALSGEGFHVLAERPGEELVVGVAGRFWALHETAHLIQVPDTSAFREFREPGCAKAAMSLRIEALADAMTRLTTETRVQCVDGAAYRRFALYWTLIKPFSGWIRLDLLRGIRRRALARTAS